MWEEIFYFSLEFNYGVIGDGVRYILWVLDVIIFDDFIFLELRWCEIFLLN